MANAARLIEIIEQDEGRENDRYRDTEGNWTIGVGHNMAEPIEPDAYALVTGQAVDEPTVIPDDITSIYDDAVNEIRDDDIETATDDAIYFLCRNGSQSHWDGLSDVRREIIINMAFNMGRPTLLDFNRFRNALLESDWEEAADEMEDSEWAREDVPVRAARLIDAMRSNDPDDLYE